METPATYLYLEDLYGSKIIYHVFIKEKPNKSLCNMLQLNAFQVSKLLADPPLHRPTMCPDCFTVKEMIDIKKEEDS